MLIVHNKASSVFAAIEKIAATASKTEKELMVKAAGSSPLFMKVCRAAYDPFVTYGLRISFERTTGIAPGMNTLEEPWVWQLLDGLAKREIAGSRAIAEVQKAIDFLDEPSAELFRRILRTDLRAGFTDGTINRVFPGTFPEYPYQRCSLPDKSNMAKWPWESGIISQEKADGMFGNVNRDGENVWATGRSGSPIPLNKLPETEKALCGLAPNTQTHGEFTVYLEGKVLPREVGNGIMNSICQGGDLPEGHSVRFDAWDQIPLSEVKPKGKYDVAYKDRLRALVSQINALHQSAPELRHFLALIPTRVVKSKADAYAHYRELLKDGKEGTICKSPAATWKDGTSKDQVKLKLEVDVDLEIVAVLPGTPGTKNEGRPGSIECRTSCSGLSVNVTVKNEAMRAALEKNEAEFIGKVIAVRANSIMEASNDGEMCSLFLPRFVETQPRIDKSAADSLDSVRDQFRNAIQAA